jgi:hypothetical protein
MRRSDGWSEATTAAIAHRTEGLTSTFFGLIAVTGMRMSSLALDRDDIDLEDGVLTIRRASSASRDSCQCVLHLPYPRRYAEESRILPRTTTPAFFWPKGHPDLNWVPVTTSPRYRNGSVFGHRSGGAATAVDRGFTICVIDSPSGR